MTLASLGGATSSAPAVVVVVITEVDVEVGVVVEVVVVAIMAASGSTTAACATPSKRAGRSGAREKRASIKWICGRVTDFFPELTCPPDFPQQKMAINCIAKKKQH